VENFWSGKLDQYCPFENDQINYLYPIKSFFNEQMNDQVILDLFEKEKLMRPISKSGNQ
jgi:hypothetical protein